MLYELESVLQSGVETFSTPYVKSGPKFHSRQWIFGQNWKFQRKICLLHRLFRPKMLIHHGHQWIFVTKAIYNVWNSFYICEIRIYKNHSLHQKIWKKISFILNHIKQIWYLINLLTFHQQLNPVQFFHSVCLLDQSPKLSFAVLFFLFHVVFKLFPAFEHLLGLDPFLFLGDFLKEMWFTFCLTLLKSRVFSQGSREIT